MKTIYMMSVVVIVLIAILASVYATTTPEGSKISKINVNEFITKCESSNGKVMLDSNLEETSCICGNSFFKYSSVNEFNGC